jgi:hypothetical protein
VAGTVRLQASVEAHADVTIIARIIEFAEGPVRITTHGHAFSLLPIDGVRFGGAALAADDEIVIDTSAPTAQPGSPGFSGIQGWQGDGGWSGFDGDLTGCTATNGDYGGNGFEGGAGFTGESGENGSAARNILVDIPVGDQHRYRLIARGGNGGTGGNGGYGGQGGWGGTGGNGGNEYVYGCIPGNGGYGGNGGPGGNGGKGGNGGNGGRGGDITVTYPSGYDQSWIYTDATGGSGGLSGAGGVGGQGGFGGLGGQGGINYSPGCLYTPCPNGLRGLNGTSGSNGNLGSRGNDGQAGANGTILVTRSGALTLSVDKPLYGIGEVTLYTVSGAQPNSQILWSSWKGGVSTGEVNAFYGDYTDAQGRWSGQSAPWTTADLTPNYTKQVSIAGRTAQATFEIRQSPSNWTGWMQLSGLVVTDQVAEVSYGVFTNSEATYRRIFARGSDNTLYVNTEEGNSGIWSGWQSLDLSITSAPVAIVPASPNDTIVNVFARGTDGSVYYRRYQVATGWQGWVSLGGYIKGTPAVVALGLDLMVFGRGSDDGLYVNRLVGTTWSGWQGLGGTLTSDPDAVVRGSVVDVFFRGASGDVIDQRWNGNYWEGPVGLGGWIEGNLDAVATYTNMIFVFARAGQTGYVNQFNGSSWIGWQSLGTAVVSDPAALSLSSILDAKIFVAHRGTDDRLYINAWSSIHGTWSGWTDNGGNVAIRPTLTWPRRLIWPRMLAIDKDTGTVYERNLLPFP